MRIFFWILVEEQERNPRLQIEESRLRDSSDHGLLEYEEGVVDCRLILGELNRIQCGSRQVLLPGKVVREVGLSRVPNGDIPGQQLDRRDLVAG